MAAAEYADYRASIQAEKKRRIQEHQAAIASRRRLIETLAEGKPSTLNLLAQGDSWFDYPLPVLNPSDIVAHLKHLPSMAPLVLSLAHHGEAAESMLGLAKIHELIEALENSDNGHFDAILFSGGGNDLAGDQFRLWLAEAADVDSDPTFGLAEVRVKDILGVIEAAYRDLFRVRDRVAPGVPIFGHGYDFAIPSNKGACSVGPWLYPGLQDRGWTDKGKGRSIVRNLLLQFDVLLQTFADDPTNNFIYVRTQGSLSDSQWANELHPTPGGFAVITAKFVAALRERFSGRI